MGFCLHRLVDILCRLVLDLTECFIPRYALPDVYYDAIPTYESDLMGRPSLSRAIPMGLIGFLIGSLFVMIMRDLQNIQPAWDSGVAIILSAFTSAGFFLWGIGAFTPSMSVHGDDHEEEESEESPLAILKGYTALITTITLLTVMGFATYALLPGTPTITQTDLPAASATGIGVFLLTIGDQTLEISQLVVFIAFGFFTIFSLLVISGIIGFTFFALSRGKLYVQGGYDPEVSPALRIPIRAFVQVHTLMAGITGRLSGWTADLIRGKGLNRAPGGVSREDSAAAIHRAGEERRALARGASDPALPRGNG